jgi:hypothetical protein
MENHDKLVKREDVVAPLEYTISHVDIKARRVIQKHHSLVDMMWRLVILNSNDK